MIYERELIREHVREHWRYESVADPFEVVTIWRVESPKDFAGCASARVGDWWVTEGRTDGYGVLLRVVDGEVRTVYREDDPDAESEA